MRTKNFIQNLLEQVIHKKGLDWPQKATIEPPRESKFGDMATNIAMVLAKQAGQKPRDLAEEFRSELLQLSTEIESIDVAGPGFLNFFFTPSFWQKIIPIIQNEKEAYGSSSLGQELKVQVEYVSANPTGPLHIGHGRGAAVGDSLARILRFTGHEVGTEYYLNDAGRQMNLLGQSIWTRYQQLCSRDVELPPDCYKGEYIRDIALQLKQEYQDSLLQEAEEKALSICRDFGLEKILEGIKTDLQNFRSEHQVWFSENSLKQSGALARHLQKMQDEQLAYEQEGALWFKSSLYGDDKDRVLRKSDGEVTYFASDIAYHADKYERGFDLVVDVWGADHHGYVPRMKAAVQALGRKESDFKVVLVQLVNLLRGGEQVAMSTRAGQFETLADVCAEVGTDAARFIFLSRKSDSHLDFDLELVKKQTMDNPVYYVQYAHARICSVFRKAEERNIELDSQSEDIVDRLDQEEDISLLRFLDRFPEVVAASANSLSPHHLSYYLQDLAGLLHRYYNKHPVLTAPDRETIQARLYLLKSVAQVLQNGLGLMGVTAPESM
jgi:arginyl-tRNA synthetase